MLSNFSEINPELFTRRPELISALQRVYGGGMDNVDLYIGGMLESTFDPGPLFRAIIKEQFQRIRDADRFWFENSENG